MIVNRQALLAAAPIKNMLTTKERNHGVSHGLAEAGYDIRIAEDVVFDGPVGNTIRRIQPDGRFTEEFFNGRFTLASAMEEFDMPVNLVGEVKDKSTWARRGLSVFNTVIEPGFCGGLTLELVYHGSGPLRIPAGAGIAQVLFERLEVNARYDGKYQNQRFGPVEAIFES